MKVAQVKKGMLVTVNSLPDGQVYTVSRVKGFTAHLTYQRDLGGTPSTFSGGCMDVSVLRKPTKEQMSAA